MRSLEMKLLYCVNRKILLLWGVVTEGTLCLLPGLGGLHGWTCELEESCLPGKFRMFALLDTQKPKICDMQCKFIPYN